METSPSLPSHYVVTIGRAFGAGGRELGHLIASKLGIAYYDKELLSEAASRAGMSEAIFKKNDERAPGMLSGLQPLSMGLSALAWYTGEGGVSGERVYRAQSDFIHAVADRGPCVIVGRTADYILRDRPRVFNIFLNAPEEACIDRIVRRADCADREKARATRRRTNKLRAEYYNFYTDRTWGDSATYHLTIDTSIMPMEAIADLVIAALHEFVKKN